MRIDANKLARCALDAVGTRSPHKLDHLILDEGDLPAPAQVHPVFDGCYDWHSSVHMHWSLLRLRAYTDLRDDIALGSWRLIVSAELHRRFTLFAGAALTGRFRFYQVAGADVSYEIGPDFFAGVQL